MLNEQGTTAQFRAVKSQKAAKMRTDNIRSILVFISLIFSSLACSEELISEESRLDNSGEGQVITVLADESKDDIAYDERPELIFSGDMKVTLSREIKADDILAIRYDLSRMTDCEKGGRGYLQVLTGHYQVDDQAPETFDYIPNYSTANRLQTANIKVPRGEEISIEFQMVDSNGCESWDSNAERGYRLQIGASADQEQLEESLSPTVITFDAEGEVSQSKALVEGAPLQIKYDLRRMSDCVSEQNGIPQWGVMAHVKSDLSEEELFQVTEIVNGELLMSELILDVPQGDELFIWFTSSNRYGCVEEDAGASFEIE